MIVIDSVCSTWHFADAIADERMCVMCKPYAGWLMTNHVVISITSTIIIDDHHFVASVVSATVINSVTIVKWSSTQESYTAHRNPSSLRM